MKTQQNKLGISLLISVLFIFIIPIQTFAKDPNMAVEKRDKNGDGKVSLDEWNKSERIFNLIDDDGDGYIVASEFAKKWGISMPSQSKKKRSVSEAGILDESKTIIADVHMHPHPNNHPIDVLTWMNRNGVKWAGNGAMVGGEEVRKLYSRIMGLRYIPFGGQSQLNHIHKAYGEKELENIDNPKFKSLMKMLKEDFEAGKLKGIGEIFANNSSTSSNPKQRRKMKVDALTNRAMLDLVSQYGGVLSIHVQWDKDSVEELKTLAKYNRRANIIMAHCGSNTRANDIRDILKNHSNIYCDLSARHPPKLHKKLIKKKPEQKIFTSSGIENNWRKLIEEMPNRFMVGTDVKTEEHYDGSIETIREGLLDNLSSETAKKVAYLNAKILLKLK